MAREHHETIYGCLKQMALSRPGKPALVCLGERFTYSALHEMVLGFASSLGGLSGAASEPISFNSMQVIPPG